MFWRHVWEGDVVQHLFSRLLARAALTTRSNCIQTVSARPAPGHGSVETQLSCWVGRSAMHPWCTAENRNAECWPLLSRDTQSLLAVLNFSAISVAWVTGLGAKISGGGGKNSILLKLLKNHFCSCRQVEWLQIFRFPFEPIAGGGR